MYWLLYRLYWSQLLQFLSCQNLMFQKNCRPSLHLCYWFVSVCVWMYYVRLCVSLLCVCVLCLCVCCVCVCFLMCICMCICMCTWIVCVHYIVKLTLQFVAKNITSILERWFRSNKEVSSDFSGKIHHPLFYYFTKLVEQYSKIFLWLSSVPYFNISAILW